MDINFGKSLEQIITVAAVDYYLMRKAEINLTNLFELIYLSDFFKILRLRDRESPFTHIGQFDYLVLELGGLRGLPPAIIDDNVE